MTTRESGAGVGNKTQLTATVNTPPEAVRLYRAGRTIFVPLGDEDTFIGEGWSRDWIDPQAAVEELHTLADALTDAFDTLLAEALAAGEVDPEKALGVAHRAFSELGEAASAVLQTLQERYPVKQGEGVLLRRETDEGGHEELRVDPSQVVELAVDGWAKPKGRK